MQFFLFISLLISSAVVALATDYPPANPTYEAGEYTKWSPISIKGSRKATIQVKFGDDDDITVTRLDLVGDAASRGFAHGALLAPHVLRFVGPELDKYLMDQVVGLDFDVSKYPAAVQKILKVIELKGALAAPAAFRKAFDLVWETEKPFFPQAIVDEINGIAEGVCFTMNELKQDCNVADVTTSIQQLNMLPELIRMACTAFGAWGPATQAKDTLVQVRALDFGGGPWSSNTIVAVHREIPGNDGFAFASVMFPGFVGAITGISNNGIGISEKVWMTYDTPDLQPGSYQGLADIFVLRTILENTKSRAEAEKYLDTVSRTWAMWVGVGDYATLELDLVGYRQNSSIPYTDVTMPSMTGQPYLNSIAYVDKHPQPSHDGPTGTLPTALTDFYGDITLETCKTITQYHQTGDVHIASYDYTGRQMNLAIGRTNPINGKFMPINGTDENVWKAYNRPYLHFNLDDLWTGV